MKFTITYEFDASFGSEKPFWASAIGIQRCGKDYAEAREKLIEELREISSMEAARVEPPTPEEVDL